MNKILQLLRRIPRRAVVMAAAAAAIVTPVVVLAYGPERKTFTMEQPAPYVTFNSITNNPNYGDEREFMTVKDVTTGSALTGQAKLVPGHEYQFQLYVHNNASETLNASGKGVAKDVTVRAALPSSVTGNDTADGFVRASNADPVEVYDTAKLTSDSKVDLEFVKGSAKLSTHFQQTALPDSLITTGVKVGHKDLSGTWNGCLEFAGVVTFKVKVKGQPNFEMYKKVSKTKANQWVDDLETKPGDVVDYMIYYKNTGTTQQDNVVIKDTLPAGMTYVAGSSTLGNSKTPNGAKISDNVTTTGVNVGSYAPNGNAWVIFSAKVALNDTLPQCGNNVLKNIGRVETDNGSKQDEATVKVRKECEQPKTPVYKCTGLNVETISRTQFKLTADKQVENAEFVKFIYVIRDEGGKEIARNENGSFTIDKVGKYTAEAILVVKVDGQEKQVPSNTCKKPFEVKEQPKENVYRCDALTVKPVRIDGKDSRDTFEFTVTPYTEGNVKVKEYNFTFGDGQTQIVGADQKTVQHVYKDAGDKKASVAITFEVDGKTVANVTGDKCKVELTVKPAECKPGIPMNDERCKEQPEQPKQPATPSSLPSTGPEAILSGLFGSSALGLGVHNWLNSRRALKSVVNKK